MSLFPGYGDSDDDNYDNREAEKIIEKVVEKDVILPDRKDKEIEKKRKRRESSSISDSSSSNSSSERLRKRKKKRDERKLRKKLRKEKRKKYKQKYYSYSSDDEEFDKNKSLKRRKAPSIEKEIPKKTKIIPCFDEFRSEKTTLPNNLLISNDNAVENNEVILNIVKKNSQTNVVKNDIKISSLKEKETKEIKLKSERDLLKNLIDNNPKDLAVWLKFIELQEEESKFRGHSVTVASDLKLAIIENALKNVGSKCVELKIEKLKCLTKLEDYSIAIKQWDIYLIQHPNSLLLWDYIINATLFNFSKFSVHVCLQIMVDCYNTLAKLLRGEIITHKAEPGTEKFLADLLIKIIKLHFQFGYTEIAMCLITYFFEFNFFKPTVLENKSHKEVVDLFVKFLSCECPKAGFEGAIGWNNCFLKHMSSQKSGNLKNISEESTTEKDNRYKNKEKELDKNMSHSMINSNNLKNDGSLDIASYNFKMNEHSQYAYTKSNKNQMEISIAVETMEYKTPKQFQVPPSQNSFPQVSRISNNQIRIEDGLSVDSETSESSEGTVVSYYTYSNDSVVTDNQQVTGLSSQLQTNINRPNHLEMLVPQNYQSQNYQLQNYQPQNFQSQNRQIQNFQSRNRQIQNYQPQNRQIHNRQPQYYQPQNHQSQNYQSQNRQLQNHQLQNYQPQNRQPQNYQLQNYQEQFVDSLNHSPQNFNDQVYLQQQINNISNIQQVLSIPSRPQNLNQINLSPTNFNQTNLNLVNLNQPNLDIININRENLDLINSNGVDFDQVNFNPTNLDRINLNQTNLDVINSNPIDFDPANLNRTNLNIINLNQANLDLVNSIPTNLNHTNFNQINLDTINSSPTNFDPTYLNQINLNQANLNLINSNGTNFDQVNFNPTNLNQRNSNPANLNQINNSLNSNIHHQNNLAYTIQEPKRIIIKDTLNERSHFTAKINHNIIPEKTCIASTSNKSIVNEKQNDISSNEISSTSKYIGDFQNICKTIYIDTHSSNKNKVKKVSEEYSMPTPNPFATSRSDNIINFSKIDYRRDLIPKDELPVSPASEVIPEVNDQIDNIIVSDKIIEENLSIDDYIKQEDEYCLLAQKENHPLSKVWITIEQIREKYNYFQITSGEYDNGDKDRHVDFKKSIYYSLFTFSSKIKEYILRQILKIFKVDIDRVLGGFNEPDIYSLFDKMNIKIIDTHPPYESLKFMERLFKFMGERENCNNEELEKIVFAIYKIIVRYGKNLEYENKGNEKFAKILKDNFINNVSLYELFYDSRFMNNIDLALDKVDIKVLSIIYQPTISERQKCFTKVDLVNYIVSFLMTGSVISKDEVQNDVHYKTMASEQLFVLHNYENTNYKFFYDWKLDDLKYISGLIMILKYQMFSDVKFSLNIIQFLEKKYSHERLETLEELFLLQEEIYADYYEKQSKVYEPAYDIFIVESLKKYPKFINLLMVYLRRSSIHKDIHIDTSFIESLQISKLPKMMAIIYNELLIFQKKFNQYANNDGTIFPNFDKLRQVILKYVDEITKMTLSPLIWKLLLQLEHKYGNKESLKRSFLKGLESAGWSKDFYIDYLSYDSSAFDNVFQLFIEKGFRIRCLKEELPVLLQ
ncbi:Protein NRDE2 homolog [Strongyloides ratti]|uniref:Protein NRDE2 homolog n=1 Tax=Strongyloides ratti TaxID=34506 RepID=A0A090L2A7_STRRB|nr:Protein NRDE2 homolog [Strongyloides ratti]CEF62207.1 Protein NRDE2 homolog [Strongyloides ratti]